MVAKWKRFGIRAWTSALRDEDGIGTLEMVLIAAVLILVALLFKDWILEFVRDLMDSAEGRAESVFE